MLLERITIEGYSAEMESVPSEQAGRETGRALREEMGGVERRDDVADSNDGTGSQETSTENSSLKVAFVLDGHQRSEDA